jgi:selenide,water dikinase
MKPLSGVRLTLITDVSHTPYSGMLPAYVAGLYEFDECHIDLRQLSQFAGATIVLDRAVGLDLEQKRLLLANHPPIQFDLLSIDIGSTPALTVPGAADHAIPVKPISQFLTYWDQIVSQIAAHPGPLRLAVVGGGAGGVELMLAVQARLSRLYRELNRPIGDLELHLLHRDSRLIPERSAWVGQRVQQLLSERGVTVHLGEAVSQISAAGSSKKIQCESGLALECDYIFWVTQASAANWLSVSGLQTDERGFVWVNDYLQTSNPQVFAAGDVATMRQHPRPKAGVFAVRQGKPLVQNLRRALSGAALRPFVPQKAFLALIGTGERTAIASRGNLAFGPSPLLWQWKDRIDRKFMQQFSDLQMRQADMRPERKPRKQTSEEQPQPMPCAGCGSKVGKSVLERALARVDQPTQRPDILLGLDAADDAAVLQIPSGQVMVQTVDHFRALISDPFVFGQVCANHCLSDLFAMNAVPQSALAIVTLPYATETKLEEMLYQLLSGAVKALSEAGAVLVGGHTTEGTELAFGLTCNGLAEPHQLWRKSGMQPGEALILTKALGTGTLFAADMQIAAKGRWIEAAIKSMQQSNQAAVTCLRQFHPSACTDVTGFGLVGHLLELVQASEAAVELKLDRIPILAGAKETLQQGIFSSLYAQNLQAAQQIANLATIQTHPLFPILFDPQTSGGLLASIPAAEAIACVAALKQAGYTEAQIIGHVLPKEATLPIRVSE